MRLDGWRAPDSVLGPAELSKGVLQARKRQSNYVEIAAFDARNEATRAALYAVGAGFIVLFPGGEVARDLFRGEDAELNQGGLDEVDAFSIGKADEGDAGEDGVSASGKFFKHAAGVVRRARLAEDVAVEGYFGVGGDDDSGAHGACGDQLSFGGGEALDEVLGGFSGVSGFVDGGRDHGERNSRVAKNFGTARGCGSENQLQGHFRQGRILQGDGGDSLGFAPAEKARHFGGGGVRVERFVLYAEAAAGAVG